MSTRFLPRHLGIGSLLLLVCAFDAATSLAGNAPPAFAQLNATESSIELRFVAPPLSRETVRTAGGEFVRVSFAGQGSTSQVGLPRLPVPRCLVQIPLDARCEVAVTDVESREIRLDAPVVPLQPPQWGDGPEPPFTFDRGAYAERGFGDAPLATLDEVGLFRGNRLSLLSLRAVQYDPSMRCLKVLERATVHITVIGGDAERTRALARRFQSPVFDPILDGLVVNRPGPSRSLTPYMPGNPVRLLVISTPAFHDDPMMRDFIAWKQRKGLDVVHVSTEEIGATSEEIRSFIQEDYFNGPVPPSLVMLVGDTPDIPHFASEVSAGTDLYYAAPIDGTYLPEMGLGRVSVADTEDLHNYLAKVMSYEKADWTSGDGWEKRAAFLAGETTWHPFEAQHNLMINSYLIPAGYEVERLYCHTHHATSQQVIDVVNAGCSQVTFTGHSGWWCWGDGPGFTQDQVRRLRNTVYPLVQGYTCESGQFMRPECFGETWIRVPHGAIAYWGATDVVATRIDEVMEFKFYEGMYDDQCSGINQTWLGGMALYAKLGYLSHYGEGWASLDMLDKYNLLGDPSIDLWTDVPAVMHVDAPDIVFEGAGSIDVHVAGLRNGMVTVRKTDGADSLFVTGWTDSLGHAVVSFAEPIHRGVLQLAITAHDCIPWLRDLRVLPPAGPTLVAGACRISDPVGDRDGCADAGESAGLRVALRNVGFGPARNVVGVISSDDPRIEVVDGRRDYGTISPGDSTSSHGDFRIHVEGTAPDGQEIALLLSVTSDEGTWSCPLSIEGEAPVLAIVGDLIDDAPPRGNGNGVADPGEIVYLILRVENQGHSDCAGLAGILSGAGLRVEGEAECDVVRAGTEGMMGSFRLEIPSGMPNPGAVSCELAVSAQGGFEASVPYELILGSIVDDLETDRGWELGAPGDDAHFGAWERVEPAGTWAGDEPVQPESDHTGGPGGICFVTENGDPEADMRLWDVDGGKATLVSPPLRLGDATSAVIGYWRWFTNDLWINGGEDWWDVDVSADGTNWVSLEHTTESANRWVHRTFDLEDFVPLTDNVRIRFVVHDDPPDALVEAGVDDFSVTLVRRLRPELYESGLLSLQPNPTSSVSRIAYRTASSSVVHLVLYDVSGRLVRKLVNGQVGPGAHVAIFDGRDEGGNRISSGAYFLRLETPEKAEGTRLTVIR